MKKKYLDIVEKDINETYKTNISSNDILNKTDYFEKNKIEPLRVRKWKISFVSMTLSFVLAIFCIFIIQFGDEIHYVGQSSKVNHQEVVKECLKEIEKEYRKVYDGAEGTILIDDELYIAIYKGTSHENLKEHIYFYIISSSKELPVTIKVDDIIIEEEGSSSWGVLTKSSSIEGKTIDLEIEYDGRITKYSVEK